MGEPQYLDPAVDWEGNGWSIEHTMYNTLLTYASAPGTPGTELVPDMATEVPTVANGGITNNGKTYTFHLRPGIKFAPPVNREVTAADVKYSIERMLSAATRPVPPGDQLLHEHRRRARVQRRQGQERRRRQGDRQGHRWRST